MRILHIDTGAEMRGGQHQVMLLMNALRQDGHECELLARAQSPLWLASVGAGVATSDVSALAIWRRSSMSDLVHAHDARAHTLAALFSRRRFVVARRVAFPMGTSLMSRWKYRKAARFLAVSRFVAEQLQTSGVPDGKIDVVYDAVDQQTWSDPWSAEYPAVALASDDPLKGRDLIEAAAVNSGVAVFYSNNLPCDLQKASMFLYISRSEGLGSAALLAMQMGVPVIASSIGGLAELFEEGVSGLYVKNHPADIARVMRRVLSSRTFSLGLIEQARLRVAEHFSTRQLLVNTLASYAKALNESGPV